MKKIFVLVIACIGWVGCIYGQTPEQKEGKTEVNEAAEMLKVAGQLVKYGYSQEEILPILQAVEIYQTFGGSAMTTDKTTEAGEADVIETQKDNKVTYDVNALLSYATQLADNDPTYLAMIENIKSRSTRGATKDYEIHTDKVNANSTDSYSIRFRGGEQAIVVVSGDGDTDLDLFVYDSNGRLVANDTDTSDDCVCIWTPRYTATYTVKIKNLGNVYNRYRLGVN